MLNLADKLILVSIDVEKGKLVRSQYLARFGLTGALLLELHNKGKLTLENKRIVITDSTNTGIDIFDDALSFINSRSRQVKTVRFISNTSLAKKARKEVLMKLADGGIVREDDGRILGIIPVKRYPVTDTAEKQKLIDGIREVYLSESLNSEDKDFYLIASLLAVCRCTRLVLSGEEKKECRKKLKEIEKGELIKDQNPVLYEVLKAIRYAISAEVAASSAASGGAC